MIYRMSNKRFQVREFHLSHKGHGEFPMTRTILASTALSLLCVGPMTATSALSRTAIVATEHALRSAHQKFADMRAAVPEPPTVFPSSRRQPYPYNFHETDGLSRNPNDCAVWGCVDSN
jgi:hypothetical protein